MTCCETIGTPCISNAVRPGPSTVDRSYNPHLANPITAHFAGWLPPFAILEHRGRTSGKYYRIPMIVSRRGETFTIALTCNAKTDWVKNVLAGGGCTIEHRGQAHHLIRSRLADAPALSWAPLPVRLIEGRVGATELGIGWSLRRD